MRLLVSPHPLADVHGTPYSAWADSSGTPQPRAIAVGKIFSFYTSISYNGSYFEMLAQDQMTDPTSSGWATNTDYLISTDGYNWFWQFTGVTARQGAAATSLGGDYYQIISPAFLPSNHCTVFYSVSLSLLDASWGAGYPYTIFIFEISATMLDFQVP